MGARRVVIVDDEEEIAAAVEARLRSEAPQGCRMIVVLPGAAW